MSETVDPLIETPTDKTQTFVYDEVGNLIEATDRKGQVSHHTYDRLNRLTQTDHLIDSSQETYTYDLFGDLIQTQNADVTYTYTYTAKHQLQSKTDSRSSKTLSWTYDAAGNIDTKTDYQGDITDYQYDNANRLTAETNPAYLQVSYHYDGAGHLLDRILSNGAQTRYGWDAAGRLTQLKNTTITGQLVNDTSYTRDRLGNILTQNDLNAAGQVTGTTTYTYDPEYRLLTADYPGTANDESFSYDKVGNRKTHTLNGSTKYYNVDAGNRLQDIRTGSASGAVYESYGYDDNGSLTSVSGNRSLTLIWDANHRVKQINTSQYRYDPKGYRIQKTAVTTNRYYLEGEHLEAIYDGNGALRDQYLRGSVIDEVVNGYHRDALQSVLGQSAHDGQLQSSQSYTAFGGSLSATGTSNAVQKYTGQESDGESGFYYYRARYYDPATGRFISEDPKGFVAGINFYAYVNNNPVNGNDPSGEFVVNPITIGATIGGVTGAIQAANAGGGWTMDNAGNIAIGALTGAVAGAIPGAFATSIGLKATVAVGSLAAGGGNLANQWAGGTSLGSTNWPQFSVQTGLGGISGLAGYGAGLSSALKVVRSGGSVEGALNFGNIYGALAGGTTQTIANLPVPTNLGGFWSSTNLPVTNSANGGFVLYPNKSNTNQMQSVYRK